MTRASRSGKAAAAVEKPAGSAPPAKSDRGFFIHKVYETLRGDILAQRVRPGVKLIPEHIAGTLNVSRTPVRHALERLCQEGYVTRIPARGYFVAEMDATEASDLYDVRYGLEIRALETALERGVDADGIESLMRLNTEYQRLLDDQSVVNRSRIDQEFHLALAGLSGNALLVRMLGDIYDRLNFRRRNDGYWFWADRGARGHDGSSEHRRIIQALQKGDGAAALAALREHLGNAHRNYRHFLATVAADAGRPDSLAAGDPVRR
ncbi:GntR family transcriptional regulator [Pigmentiphaga soli]|uniref:GntR family transcriptional regulator n=1 Tax=Pigmentiphaga soli TaxID=1007095 RepID=A0ABP8H4U3_9BURK